MLNDADAPLALRGAANRRDVRVEVDGFAAVAGPRSAKALRATRKVIPTFELDPDMAAFLMPNILVMTAFPDADISSFRPKCSTAQPWSVRLAIYVHLDQRSQRYLLEIKISRETKRSSF